MLADQGYELLREMQQNEKYKRNYVKVTTLLMLHLGESPEKVAIFLGISIATVSNYLKKYQSAGLDAYLSDHYKAYQGKLSSAQEQLLKTGT